MQVDLRSKMSVGQLWYKFVRRPWKTFSDNFVVNILLLFTTLLLWHPSLKATIWTSSPTVEAIAFKSILSPSYLGSTELISILFSLAHSINSFRCVVILVYVCNSKYQQQFSWKITNPQFWWTRDKTPQLSMNINSNKNKKSKFNTTISQNFPYTRDVNDVIDWCRLCSSHHPDTKTKFHF